MIKIAIVDDEREERNTLKGYYEKLQIELGEKLEICEFSSGEKFLERFDNSFQLLCLDIDMDGMDGVNTAKEVRKQNTRIIIIFITNMAQMAIRGYEVQALDFVLKPVGYPAFAMKMRTALNIIRNQRNVNITINTDNGRQVILSTNDLYYIEVSGHYLFYHTRDNVYRQKGKGTLKEAEEKLNGMAFKRCNSCYLVNLKHVNCVDKDDIRVGGEWLKISRPRKKDFLQALANYMGGITV